MAGVPLHYLRCRAFCYATEDEERVHEALEAVLPPDSDPARDPTEGHHGDPIVVLSASLESADDIRWVVERLAGMPGFDRVITELPERVDEDCSFYLRLDKQRAFAGELALGNGIELRGKIEAYPAKREAAIDNLRTAFQDAVDRYHAGSNAN